ncbi:hypothetical protein [Salipiger sp. PrR003]|uniref:hypothetical protein n=1 Tax=Salipiger sp. PrR003 TaxID=2706776 RepID=UPI0013DAD06F|nr:hypothetical protein [Salipiger sp. PrR003]NDV52891.1 hypothetical protein [Salipiger sp. PrR003]
MTPKQVRSLELVKRMRKLDLEAKAGRLGELRHKEAMLSGEMARLSDLLMRDNAQQPVETASYIPLFVKSVTAQSKIIEEHLTQTSAEREIQEEAVREAFGEVKSLDIVIGNAKAEIQAVRAKKEAAELEEIALMIHQRGKAHRTIR